MYRTLVLDRHLWLGAIAFLAGMVQAFTPDRWMPLAVAAWRKRWSRSKLSALAALSLTVHVLGGVLLYFIFLQLSREKPLSMMSQQTVFLAAASVCAASFIFRYYRFTKIGNTFFGSRELRAPLGRALRILGPCEAILPILIKSGEMGDGYLTPFLLFLTGTWLSGVWMANFAHAQCDRPSWMPQWILKAQSTRVSVSAVAAVSVIFAAIWIF